MPRKTPKKRLLWLSVSIRAPRGMSKSDVGYALIDSIRRGTYDLPRGVSAEIHWRNKEDAPNRVGEWENELNASAASSPGFEEAVISYIRRRIR